MYVLIFETWPDEQYRTEYLETAQQMRAEVEKIKGFISVERFQSLYEDGKLLSMSFWESEAAMLEWKSNTEHKIAQMLGRTKYFHAYRIRIAKVERDYDFNRSR